MPSRAQFPQTGLAPPALFVLMEEARSGDVDWRRGRVALYVHYAGEDVRAMGAAVSPNTILLVGSAPTFSHGVFDSIPELAALARERGLWLHVDACVGGFLAPFVRRLGYPIPPFNFAVEGVRSMSADLH